MKNLEFTRRSFLGITVVVSAALTLPTRTPAAIAAPINGWGGSQSANGWPILATATLFRVEGCNESVGLAQGDSATILLYVARRLNYEINTLRDGEITGHSTNRAVAQSYESNYLSGTAIAVHPALYPVGASGLYYPNELAVIRNILAEVDGTVDWGGDAAVAKESHFQIALPPGDRRITNTATRIRGWDQAPGRTGAGAVNAFDA
ncbi:hypothetical protein GY21_21040 [Cryobacterium roopkundense]|uniref:Peptidase M15C domain-containing protein n=1 Tax=Cryobacterium roopkundense TaxID=1001240 RepID=A0A099J0D9_9MICO|nr:hypothetical protein [Cryobacterium roopkundense]KGJ71605.1 hypothetical protein GY21_21040 [Cryobacterium roopkundense]MBB5642314.1 hypothetical protein [Cryobacterium roopkundense]